VAHDLFYDLVPRRPEPVWEPRKVALITIDMQYLDAHPDGWMGRLAASQGKPNYLDERWEAIGEITPNIRRLQDAFREAGQEVMHVRVAYRTADGRDGGTAYMPEPDVQPVLRDERDYELLAEVGVEGDEMVFSKTSASVFNSTAIDTVLRKMEITHLVVTGIVTDGCVELSARDASDRGYRVTLVGDGCAATTRKAHEDAIQRMTDGSFITAHTTDEVIERLRNMT
jgi:ureidoacrylate peracid hydrolase